MSTDSQGPPLSIFGNKFHSRFLGTGQKVPGVGNKGASTAEHASHCPPSVGMPPIPGKLAGPGVRSTGAHGISSPDHTVAGGRFGDFLSRWTQNLNPSHPSRLPAPSTSELPLTSTPGCFFLAAPRACLQAAFHLVPSEQAARSQQLLLAKHCL